MRRSETSVSADRIPWPEIQNPCHAMRRLWRPKWPTGRALRRPCPGPCFHKDPTRAECATPGLAERRSVSCPYAPHERGCSLLLDRATGAFEYFAQLLRTLISSFKTSEWQTAHYSRTILRSVSSNCKNRALPFAKTPLGILSRAAWKAPAPCASTATLDHEAPALFPPCRSTHSPRLRRPAT